MKLRSEESERSKLGICTYFNQTDGRCQILANQSGYRLVSIDVLAKEIGQPSHADKFSEGVWDAHHTFTCKDMPNEGKPSVSAEVAAAQKKCTGYKEGFLRGLI